MTIFGRSPNLILGAATAIFNVIVAFHIQGFSPTVDQIAVVNLALGSIIGLVANSDNLTAAAGKAAIARVNGKT